jgi:hypothetical protein
MIESLADHPVNQTMRCEQHGSDWFIVRSSIICRDGFKVSIQASSSTYCSPRTKADAYTHVELGFPSEADDLIIPFAEDKEYTNTVYPYVPSFIVLALLHKHGGIASGQLPPLVWTHNDTMRVILTDEYLRGEEE